LGGILLLGMFLVALIGTLLLATTGETAAVSEHVQQKTEALRAETEERLRLESRMLASQRLESLGVLTGSIAHEFNNLLAVIMGNTELVRSEILDAESQECLEQILLASRKAAERCRQMLAYAGQGRFAFAVVDLRQVTLDAKRAITRPGNVTIGVDFEDNFPMIDADEPQIRQLITSMLQNAIEAYGEREGTVQVRVGTMMFADVNKEDLVASERNFQKVVFVEVRDWGCGMDEEVRQRIFEPFFSTKFPGRGMGLAASLGIVRGHRGAMSVWSRVGEGSIFRIYFAAREEIGKKTPPAFKSVPLQAT
jgi:signal transduction histidine kinase